MLIRYRINLKCFEYNANGQLIFEFSGIANKTPTLEIKNIIEEAIKLNVDIIAASSLAAGHLTLVPKLRDELDNRGHDEIHVIVGGVIPKEDFSTLIDIGASAIFATGTNIINSAMEMLQIIESSNS